jgi:urate oxidase
MSHSLAHHVYGKSQVRVSHVRRNGPRHEFTALSTEVLLSGEFEVAYTGGDNSPVIPTDTIRNTVYALAGTNGIASCEAFAVALGSHFVSKYSHVGAADIRIREQVWTRMYGDDGEHPHAFVGGSSEHNTCAARVTSEGVSLTSGLDGLQVLKTTQSGFSGFLRDEYTTLAETDDRILATTITADWSCRDVRADWTAHRRAIRDALLDVFANRFSPSVQRTLFEMAEAALDAFPVIDEIAITMPNQHHLPFDLRRLGLEDRKEIFVPTTEPFGTISATVKRGES